MLKACAPITVEISASEMASGHLDNLSTMVNRNVTLNVLLNLGGLTGDACFGPVANLLVQPMPHKF